MQVPAVGHKLLSTSFISSKSNSLARNWLQYLLQSVQAPNRSPRHCPAIIGPATEIIEGISNEAAAIIWAGVVLSHPPTITTASIG